MPHNFDDCMQDTLKSSVGVKHYRDTVRRLNRLCASECMYSVVPSIYTASLPTVPDWPCVLCLSTHYASSIHPVLHASRAAHNVADEAWEAGAADMRSHEISSRKRETHRRAICQTRSRQRAISPARWQSGTGGATAASPGALWTGEKAEGPAVMDGDGASAADLGHRAGRGWGGWRAGALSTRRPASQRCLWRQWRRSCPGRTCPCTLPSWPWSGW